MIYKTQFFRQAYFCQSYIISKSLEAERGTIITSHCVVFKTRRGLEQKNDKMCVLEMDGKGDLYLNKFVLLCKNEIIKRLINGSYHLAEPSNGPSTIGIIH